VRGAGSVSAVAWVLAVAGVLVAWPPVAVSAVKAAAGSLVALPALAAAKVPGLPAVGGVIRSAVQTTYPIMNSARARPSAGNRAAPPEDAPIPAMPPPGPADLLADTARNR